MSNSFSSSNAPLHTNPSNDEPPALPEQSREPRSFGEKVVIAGLVVFALSLALPAMEFNLFSKSSFYGIHAAMLVFPVALEKPLSLMPILAFGNLWILALPFIARSRRASTVAVASLVTWGVALAAILLSYQEDGDGLLMGYYVWVTSFIIAAIGATWAAIDRAASQRRSVES
jgi:hypothetical protein